MVGVKSPSPPKSIVHVIASLITIVMFFANVAGIGDRLEGAVGHIWELLAALLPFVLMGGGLFLSLKLAIWVIERLIDIHEGGPGKRKFKGLLADITECHHKLEDLIDPSKQLVLPPTRNVTAVSDVMTRLDILQGRLRPLGISVPTDFKIDELVVFLTELKVCAEKGDILGARTRFPIRERKKKHSTEE